MAEKQPTNTNTLRGSLSATTNADSHGGDGSFGGGDGDGEVNEGWRRCCRRDDDGGSGLVAATGRKSPGVVAEGDDDDEWIRGGVDLWR
nr:hypothetical protein [Tanacetum cinerariifolium]